MSKHNIIDLATNLEIESERKFCAQSSKTQRVKIARGHAWLVRILPFPQGPSREIFARLAHHWIGGRTVLCKTDTAPSFGGDPSYDCPICATATACKNEARDDDERDEFYQVESRVTYRCYCLVLKKENDRQQCEEMTGDELLTPYEFNIPKSSFALLAAKIERSKSRPGAEKLGLIDLEKGTDLWAIRDKKNSLTFDLSEEGPLPVFSTDEFFDEKLARVWKQLRQPSVKFLSDDRLAAIADMIAEKSFEKAAKSLTERSDNGDNHGSRGGSRGRFHEEADEPRGRGRAADPDEGEEAPRRPVARSSGFARAQAALGADDSDQVPGAEVPARSRAAAAAVMPEEAGDNDDADPQEAVEEAPPVTSRRGGSAVKPAAKTAPATKVSVPAAVAASRRAGAAIPKPTARDTASGRIEDESPGEGEPAEENQDPAPPEDVAKEPVTRTTRPTPARSSLHDVVRSSVANLASRGR